MKHISRLGKRRLAKEARNQGLWEGVKKIPNT